MNDKPILSVIVAVYNAEKTIKRCLDSIFMQRNVLAHPDMVEVVVVDDASSDQTGEIMAQYRETQPSLKIVTHTSNRREANTRNTGIENSTGIYMTFLDADDEYKPTFLETILVVIMDNHPDLIHYCYARYTPDGNFISRTHFKNPGYHLTTAMDEQTLRAVYQDTAFGIMTSGGVYRRAAAANLRFSPEFPISPDRHFGWEFFRNCANVFQIDEPLYIYYQYKDSVSRQLTDDAIEGLLKLDRIFWEEFQSHSMFFCAAKYGFRRLFPGVMSWHFDIVFGKSDKKRIFAYEYFKTLLSYLGGTAAEELGFGYAILRFAVKIKSSFLVLAYRVIVLHFWYAVKARFPFRSIRAKHTK